MCDVAHLATAHTSELSMTVCAKVQGTGHGWSGSKEVTVPVNSTVVNYVLSSKPVHPGEDRRRKRK